MLVLGHTGITLGIAILVSRAFSQSYSLPTEENRKSEPTEPLPELPGTQHRSRCGRPAWAASLANHIDIKLLLIGSLLPDFIDKPVGLFFFRDTFSNGRIFCHTLAFLLLITLAGFYLYRSHEKTWLLTLSFGTFTHLIFDQVWLTPQTLLWPFYGWTFQKYDLANWHQNILYALHTEPALYVPELVGIAILIWFGLILVRRRKVYVFIRNGRVL